MLSIPVVVPKLDAVTFPTFYRLDTLKAQTL
jgi:hypothetical protein